MSVRLSHLSLRGFKTIHELVDFTPSPLNVLIGANGAGKSNFIAFFKMLSKMLSSPGELQLHVAQSGGASKFLYDGPGVTKQIEASLTLETEEGSNDYCFSLAHAAADTLIFTEEKCRFSGKERPTPYRWTQLGVGHKEALINERADRREWPAWVIRALLNKCVVYQFHDTSPTSRIRHKWQTSDAWWLKQDGANLGAFLLQLRESREEEKSLAYRRIVDTLQLIVPFFADFELESENGTVILRWREKGSDVAFDASQASDGMLRAFALVTLLGQPPNELPAVLLLDEPELGLHPHAVSIISSMLRTASKHVQVILATQSAALLDEFEPENVVVVSRPERKTLFERKRSAELKEWLEDYSLGDLWRKNLIGGNPGG